MAAGILVAAGILALSIVLLAAPAQPAPPEAARGTGESCCNVVELRQYTVRPGRREDLIELFDGTFADPLDATGMTVIGQFRDLDRPDRFVWIASPGNYAAYQATLDADREWTQAIWPTVRAQLTRDPEVLRLTPTPRSRLRE